jgi:hypothetical protein
LLVNLPPCRSVPGVSRAGVFLLKETAEVQLEGGAGEQLPRVLEAVRQAGFDASVLDASPGELSRSYSGSSDPFEFKEQSETAKPMHGKIGRRRLLTPPALWCTRRRRMFLQTKRGLSSLPSAA